MGEETTSELDDDWGPDRFAPLRARPPGGPELLKEILALEACWRSILEAPPPEKPAGWRDNKYWNALYAEQHERAKLARIGLERACKLTSRGQLDGLGVIDFACRYRMTLMLVERLYDEHFCLKREREGRLNRGGCLL